MDVIKPVSILEDNKNQGEPSSSSQDGPILNQLHEHLRYAFLGEKSKFLVIISASLILQEEEKLLDVLRKHKSVLGWSISDINGISPTICMHKILMEEFYKPSIKHQQRLNLVMKEVV